MNRFFVDDDNVSASDIVIIEDRDVVGHISKSLRLKDGDKIEIVTKCTREFIGEITCISKTKVQVKLLEEVFINRELGAEITIFQGSPKHKKLDLIVQKCVECGVYEIIPVDMERSIKLIKKSSESLINRLNKISLSASEQSKRLIVPRVLEAYSFDEMLDSLDQFDLVITLDENERTKTLSHISERVKKSKRIAVVIGPEGGISDGERAALHEVSHSISLGNRILRTETAGIAVLSMLSIWL